MSAQVKYTLVCWMKNWRLSAVTEDLSACAVLIELGSSLQHWDVRREATGQSKIFPEYLLLFFSDI